MWDTRQRPIPPRPAPLFALVCGEGVRRRLFRIHGERLRVGSSPDCDICLLDGGLAPVQVEIERAGERLLLFHRGERVPTRVDGHPVPVAHLDGGERLTLGTLTIRVIRLPRGSGSAASASNPSTPVVISRTEGPGNLREALRNALRRSPSLFLSGIIHLVALLLLSQVDVTAERREPLHLTASLDDSSLSRVDAFEPEPPVPLPTELEEPEDLREISDPDPSGLTDTRSSDDSNDAPLDRPIPAAPGLGSGGFRTGLPDMGGLPAGVARRFRSLAGRLRARGLDLAIVFDSTLSMADFVGDVKRDVADMINVIGAVVPGFRIAMVTYKGTPDLSPVLLSQDFTVDRYEIINFLDDIDSRGGAADARSALAQGLRFAVRDLEWRRSAEQVIVLIGDAPPFADAKPIALAWAQRFAGRLSTIYKASGGLTEQQHRAETIETMQALAAGRGEFSLYDGEGIAVRRLVYAALGSRYARSIDHVFAARRDRWQDHVVGRKIAAHDYDWLFDQLERHRVHPSVVDALIGLSGPYVAQRCYLLLRNTTTESAWMLPRLVHILRRLTGRPDVIAYDLDAPSWFRDQQLDQIGELLGARPQEMAPPARGGH